VNQHGNPRNLRASQPGNRNALKFGVYSARALAPRAREIADALLAASHAVPLDQIAAEEIGSLVALLEAVDRDLLERGFTDRRGQARSLLDYRVRLSGRLERWLREFGATPASRVEWVERMSRGESIANLVRADMAEGSRLLGAAHTRGDLDELEAKQGS
jgi:hypothetical protein